MSYLLAKKTNIYSINDLKKHYENKTGGYWFTKETMRFFRSRLSGNLFYCQNTILFISSECGHSTGVTRLYSIREYNTQTGSIDTIGLGFRGYKTRSSAITAALKIQMSKNNE